jgi:elongation factor G
MHSDKREEIDTAGAGDIVAVMGVDTASGDTYAAENKYCSLESMFVPEAVIKMAIMPTKRDGLDRLSKALQRFTREDPTFKVSTDDETGETVIAGMGELHLDIYVERIRREYKVDVEVGAPKVSYREAPTRPTEYDYKHKKQTGGSGQYAHIVGDLSPMPEDSDENFEFKIRLSVAVSHVNTYHQLKKAFECQWKKARLQDSRLLGSRQRLLMARITMSTLPTWHFNSVLVLAFEKRS